MDIEIEMENGLDFTDTDGCVIEDDSECHDAMGDIVDPDNMDLSDFEKEWVWKDNGLGKDPWFMKPTYADQGIGRNFPKNDINESLLNKMADSEVKLINEFGLPFVQRIAKLAGNGLVGDRDENIWFTNDQGEKIYARAEVLEFINDAERWWIQSLPMKALLTHGTEAAVQSAGQVYQFFKNNKDKRWSKLKDTIIESAILAKMDHNGTISNEDVENCVENVQTLLGVQKLSHMMYTFTVRFFWTVIKTRFNGAQKALLVKYLDSKSKEKDLAQVAERHHIDNLFVE